MTPDPATAWLLAEYDSIDFDDPCPSDVCVQPIVTFKSIMDAGQAMRLRDSDYTDPERWFL